LNRKRRHNEVQTILMIETMIQTKERSWRYMQRVGGERRRRNWMRLHKKYKVRKDKRRGNL